MLHDCEVIDCTDDYFLRIERIKLGFEPARGFLDTHVKDLTFRNPRYYSFFSRRYDNLLESVLQQLKPLDLSLSPSSLKKKYKKMHKISDLDLSWENYHKL